MPPKQSQTLTDAELRVMKVLWEKGSGTVQQVLDSMEEKPSLAYNSVLTIIRILERKGYLQHSKDGRAHVYSPVVGQQDATRSEIRHLVSRFFRNSHEDLVLNILEDQGIDADELSRLRKMLDHPADDYYSDDHSGDDHSGVDHSGEDHPNGGQSDLDPIRISSAKRNSEDGQ